MAVEPLAERPLSRRALAAIEREAETPRAPPWMRDRYGVVMRFAAAAVASSASVAIERRRTALESART